MSAASSTVAPTSSRRVFALCFLAGLCEGYDMLVAGVTAPKFAPIFALNPGQLGWVFSASTLGLFIGALIGGRLADHVGRRAVVIGSLVLLGLFSIGTALVSDLGALLAMRFLTGIGLGGTLPNILALTNESSRPEQATMRVTMLGSAMPFGGALVGLLMVAAPDLDWRTVFWIGGLAPLAVAGLMVFSLPESQTFRKRQAPGASASVGVALAGDRRLAASLLIWTGSFFIALTLYMMINWLPLMLTGKGFQKPEVGAVIMMLTFGGAASGLVFGALTRLRRRGLLYVFTWMGMVASVAGMALAPHDLSLICAASFGIGFFVSGGQFLLYALSTELYPPQVRGTGVGFAVGIGRLGAVAGPLLAGGLLMANQNASAVMLAVAPLIFVSLAAALPLVRRSPERKPAPAVA